MIDVGNSLVDWYQEFIQDKILAKLQEFSEQQSGFSLENILNFYVNINKFTFGNHVGSSYIKLPDEIARKRDAINIHNNEVRPLIIVKYLFRNNLLNLVIIKANR